MGVRASTETSGGGEEVAKGLMGSSPPSLIEGWGCCSLHSYFHTHFLPDHNKSSSAQHLSSNLRKNPEHLNVSHARP